MKTLNRLYGIVFLYHGILFALSFVLIEWTVGAQFSLNNFLIRILIFGTLEYLIFAGYRKPRLKCYGVQNLLISDFYTSQNREVSSLVSRDEFLKKLEQDPELERMEVQPNQGGIELVSGSLVDLPGNKIIIEIKDPETQLTDYDIRIKSKWNFFLFDNGRSKELLEHLEWLLDHSFQQEQQTVKIHQRE